MMIALGVLIIGIILLGSLLYLYWQRTGSSRVPPMQYPESLRDRLRRHAQLIKETELLAILSLKGAYTRESYQSLGQALHSWQDANPFVRQIIGLDQLDAGHPPRSVAPHCLPPDVTAELNQLHHRNTETEYWSALIIHVATDSATKESADSLVAALSDWSDRLHYFWDASTYEFYMQ